VVPILVRGRVGSLSSIHFLHIAIDSNFVVCVRWKVFASECSHGRLEQILAATIWIEELTNSATSTSFVLFLQHACIVPPWSDLPGRRAFTVVSDKNFGQELSMNLSQWWSYSWRHGALLAPGVVGKWNTNQTWKHERSQRSSQDARLKPVRVLKIRDSRQDSSSGAASKPLPSCQQERYINILSQ